MAHKAKYSEPDYALSMRERKDSPWYLPNIEKNLVSEARQLLEEYSKIPSEQIVAHIHDIRDKAWRIRAYPCTGLGRWLVPTINLTPAYEEIISRLKDGQKYVDVGAYLGQDLRKLVFDGAPSENLYAVDIVSHWDLGFELFKDHGRFSAHFLEADIMRVDEDARLSALKGRFGVISITHVIHQWLWTDQVQCCKNLAKLSKPGTLVVGFQMGNVKAFEMVRDQVDEAGKKQPRVSQFRHSPESFAEMWRQVGRETRTSWESEVRLRSWEEVGWDPADQKFLPEGSGLLDFVIRRSR